MITVYGKPSCPQCDSLKKTLEKIGKEYQYLDITVDSDAFDELASNGLRSLPQVKVDGKFLNNIMEIM